jgi:hypothetical protein
MVKKNVGILRDQATRWLKTRSCTIEAASHSLRASAPMVRRASALVFMLAMACLFPPVTSLKGAPSPKSVSTMA